MSEGGLNMADLRAQAKRAGQMRPKACQWTVEAGSEYRNRKEMALARTRQWEKEKVVDGEEERHALETEYYHGMAQARLGTASS